MSEGVVREDSRRVVGGGFIAPSIGQLEQVLYFATAPSAPEKTKQVLDQGRLRVPGAVVVWDETIGRRTGSKAVPNGWWAGNGSLTATFVFAADPDRTPEQSTERTAAALIQVAASFQPSAPLTFRKPNDLFLNEFKAGAISAEEYGVFELITVRLNCAVDLAKAPAGISESAARLIDVIDADQLPLKQASTLTNTFLKRLMAALPDKL